MIKHLYDSFAERWYRGGSIYFYSDPHFGDIGSYLLKKEILPIPTLEAMGLTTEQAQSLQQSRCLSLDKLQILNINRKIGKLDTIIFLGDIGNCEFIKQIRAYKVLIKGNHDTGNANYTEYFDEIYEGSVQISSKIVLSHEPLSCKYALNIHGHTHGNSQVTEIKCKPHIYVNDGNYFCDVCSEHLSYTPICIKEIVESGVLKNIEDIHRVTIDRATERKTIAENELLHF